MDLTTPWLLPVGLLAVGALVVGTLVTGRRRVRVLAAAGVAGRSVPPPVPAGRWLSFSGLAVLAIAMAGPTVDVPTPRSAGTVIVAMAKDGSAVRLSDIATVDDSFAEQRTLVRVNGDEAVTFEVRKQSGTNTVEVAHGVKARMATLEKQFPKGLTVAPIIDQAHFIERELKTVEDHIVLGGFMAILVILVFMMDLRSTLISAVALPTSVVGTFFVMFLFGFTPVTP